MDLRRQVVFNGCIFVKMGLCGFYAALRLGQVEVDLIISLMYQRQHEYEHVCKFVRFNQRGYWYVFNDMNNQLQWYTCVQNDMNNQLQWYTCVQTITINHL